MKTTEDYVWVIAYIDVTTVHRIARDLLKSNQYQGIEYRIPMVQILKKQFKGKEKFDQVPLLFHYGFFKIPLLYAINVDLINQIKSDITCISYWVQDPARTGVRASRFIEEDDEFIYLTPNQEYHDDIRNVVAATATEKEIEALMKIAEDECIHSSEDIDRLKVGDIVTLRGYPFDDMQAKIETINKKSKKIQVYLKLSVDDDDQETEEEFGGNLVTVSFDNVFYSIYLGPEQYDDEYKPNREKPITDYQSKTFKNETE